jgi:hypothetical protein|tara:strand:- start:3330 stop:3542 length:213 start_codon:yes stop_codon:yes gene_type:complete
MAQREQEYHHVDKSKGKGVPSKYVAHAKGKSAKDTAAKEIIATGEAYRSGKDINVKAVQAARTKRKSAKA